MLSHECTGGQLYMHIIVVRVETKIGWEKSGERHAMLQPFQKVSIDSYLIEM